MSDFQAGIKVPARASAGARPLSPNAIGLGDLAFRLAGQAVVGAVLGAKPKKLVLHSHHKKAGTPENPAKTYRVVHSGRVAWDAPVQPLSTRQQEAKRFLVASLAGVVAIHVHRQGVNSVRAALDAGQLKIDGVPKGEHREAIDVVCQASGQQSNEVVGRSFLQAFTIIASTWSLPPGSAIHAPGVSIWRVIQQLAAELAEQKAIRGTRVLELVRAAMPPAGPDGEPPRVRIALTGDCDCVLGRAWPLQVGPPPDKRRGQDGSEQQRKARWWKFS